MTAFSEKLRSARQAAGLNQTELAEKAGVTRRSIFAYENGASVPRPHVTRRIAAALDVTVAYLTNEDAVDPDEGRVREENIEMARERFGAKGAREAARLLDMNNALFTGGELTQEDKDAFFNAIMTAYITAKEDARRRFTPKGLRKADAEDESGANEK